MKKIIAVILGFVLACLALFLFKTHDFLTAINTTTNIATKPSPRPDKSSYNILILGYGGVGHDGAYLTDTMMVIHVNFKTNKAILISMPRDLWVKVPSKSGGFHAKINSVYEMGLYPKEFPDIEKKYQGEQGASELIRNVVGDLIGQPIDNYVGIDFHGFTKMIDTLDGVDVTVEKTFDDYVYPIDGKETNNCGKQDTALEDAVKQATQEAELAFPCRYEHIHFDKGPTHLDGTTALKYARSRHSLQDGNDFGRAKRQQLVLEGVKEKVLSVSFVPKILPLMDEAKNYVRTDIDVPLLQKFFAEAKQDSKKYHITNLVLNLDNFLKNSIGPSNEFILQPRGGVDDWGSIRKWISDTLEGITPTLTPHPTTELSPTKKINARTPPTSSP